MEIRRLLMEDIKEDLLKDFQRDEEVKQALRNVGGKLVLKDVCYFEHWDEERKRQICRGLKETCSRGGSTFACYEGEHVMGFAAVEGELFGNLKQYMNLSMLHVTNEYRGKGLGKLLFMKCAEEALRKGAMKLYISTSSSKNAQAFYSAVGCRPAEEVNLRLQELEPYDIQLEFKL